jgi:pyruvate ferredoxin oxidoreductase gamma subunit
MIEVLFYGRGGQGAFTAARILGAAWILKSEQSFALAFPSFGPERRGAPVRAFTKLDNKPINSRSEIQKSDFIIYLDDTLFNEASLPALKEGGKVIVNSAKQYSSPHIIAIDAGKIALEILKLPIANTVMLGALSAICREITLPEIEQAISTTMSTRLIDGNIAVVRAAREALS